MVDGPVSRTPYQEMLVTLQETQKQNAQSQKTIAGTLGAACMDQEVYQTLCGRHRGHRLRIWLIKPTDTGAVGTKEIEVDIDAPQAVLFRYSGSIPPFVRAITHYPPPAWNIAIPECSDSVIESTLCFWQSVNATC